MSDARLEQVKVLLIDPDAGSRKSIQVILQNTGFRNFESGTKFADLETMSREPGFDLLICELDLGDGNVLKWIRDMRHQKAGCDPFLPVIATTWHPTPEVVKRTIDAGADDLLTKPLSATRLRGRIQRLMVARRPFVVTSDYIGPDRHRSVGRPSTAKLLNVPNPLWIRSMGQPAVWSNEVQTALQAINTQKIHRHGERMAQAMQRLVPMLESPAEQWEVSEELQELTEVAEDTRRRMQGTALEHVSELCQTLVRLLESIGRSPNKAAGRDIAMLIPLSQAIQASFAGAGEGGGEAPDMIASEGGRGLLLDAEAARALEKADTAKPARRERREKFLLRLLVGKISHLLSNHTGRRQIIPRAFLTGFNEYLRMLLGPKLYEELNPKARDLLKEIGSDDDTEIWQKIQENPKHRAFSFVILVHILLRFANFSRGKRNFLSIVNRVIGETLGDNRALAGRDAFTEGHFNLVFISLFSEVFEEVGGEQGRQQLDALIGKGVSEKVIAIQKEYQSQMRGPAELRVK